MQAGNSLIAAAEGAQDIAAGFSKFLTPIPEAQTDITAIIGDLYIISSVLRQLSEALATFQYAGKASLITGDLDMAIPSLTMTIEDALDRFGDLGPQTGKNLSMGFKGFHLVLKVGTRAIHLLREREPSVMLYLLIYPYVPA
ncbi:MAG: hypothetical protein M1819_003956 [Sarea resinae]|nr:MAG: hypothetical protein M1819_003956 [Sarea resinae]